MSYILKFSLLETALSDAGINLDTHLIHSPGGIFFDAHFWPPNANCNYERLYLRASAVFSPQAFLIRRYMENSVIPELITWLQAILTLASNSPVRVSEQYFRREIPSHLITK